MEILVPQVEMAERRRPGFTLEWRIEKGMLKCPAYFCHSYLFSLECLQITSWIVEMKLQNDQLCFSINRFDDVGPDIVDIECDLDLLLVQQDPDAPRPLVGNSPFKIRKVSFKKGEGSRVLNIDPLKKIDALKDEDVLLLRCRIWPYGYSFLYPLRHLVRSHGSSPECFTWTLRDFSLFQRGDKKQYVWQKKGENPQNFSFELFLGDDNDTIYIKATVLNHLYWISSMRVLDSRAGTTLCLQNRPFAANGIPINIPLRVRKSMLLAEKEKFLPNDELTLYFDLRTRTCKGVLEKIIVGYSGADNKVAPPNTNGVISRDCTDERTQTTSSFTEDPILRSSNAGNSPTLPNSSMALDLYNLFKEEKLTDFELRIGSETVRVHKNILAARSPVFFEMMTKGCDGVDIEDMKMDTVKHLLEFLYLDSVTDVDWKAAIKLYLPGHKYHIVGLKKKCTEILKSKLCVQNVCPILCLADTHSDVDLKQFVQKFILQNWDPVLSSQEWDNFAEENMSLALSVMLKKRCNTPNS